MSIDDVSLGDVGEAGIADELGGPPQVLSLMRGMNLLERRMRRTRLRLNQESRGNSESIAVLNSTIQPVVRLEISNGTAIVELQQRNDVLRAELEGLRKELVLQRRELQQSGTARADDMECNAPEKKRKLHVRTAVSEGNENKTEDDVAGLFEDSDCSRSVGEYEEDSFLVRETSDESEEKESDRFREGETVSSDDDTTKKAKRKCAIQEKLKKRRAVLEDSDSE